MPKVLISYRHESNAHAAQVRALAERLRDRLRPLGIEIVLDQFLLEAKPGGPTEGWPKWCSKQVKESVRVVMIVSPGWAACFNDQEPPDAGAGVACEAHTIWQELYDAHWKSDKFRVCLLKKSHASSVPTEIKGFHCFGSPQDEDSLCAWLQARPALKKRATAKDEITWPKPVAGFEHGLANRSEKEWPAVVALLSGETPRKRVLLFEGPSNCGKSELVTQCALYAEQAGMLVGKLDFKGGLRSAEEVLGALTVPLAELLPEFAGAGGARLHVLQRELRELRRPVLLILDAYEKARALSDLADWVEHQLLAEVNAAPALAVILAGQQMPDLEKVPWRDHVQHFKLGPITEHRHWTDWLARKFPTLPRLARHTETLVTVNDGWPGPIATQFKFLARREQA